MGRGQRSPQENPLRLAPEGSSSSSRGRSQSLHGRRRLRDLLRRLHETRTSIRAYERDVEQLSYVFARARPRYNGADSPELLLATMRRTYDRAYDLCLYKLDRVQEAWVTATNIFISLTILIVTILFWMEFR